jgi:hypothetical protein
MSGEPVVDPVDEREYPDLPEVDELEGPENPINDISGVAVIEGNVYAFLGEGGFTMERGFETIKKREQDEPEYVDVTGAVQLAMGVDIFNGKLGEFNTIDDVYPNDEITIDAEEFGTAISDENIISLGNYSTLYSDFASYVDDYFGNDGGFESLFVNAEAFEIDGDRADASANVFDNTAFLALFTGEGPDAETGAYISDLSGTITISNVSSILKYVVDANVFGNRDPSDNNWGVGTGFVAGDLIWIPSGMSITLNLAIDQESFAPLNNRNYEERNSVFDGNVITSTAANSKLITRTVTAPLLIKLVE